MTKGLSMVNKLWLKSAELLNLNPEMGVQYTEMRKAFYAGVGALLVFQREDIALLEEDEGAGCLQMLTDEVARFWENECEKWEKENR